MNAVTKKYLLGVFLAGAIVLAVYLASFLPSADWLHIYDATARHFLHGFSPYDRLYPDCAHCVFVNPPWTLLMLIPFTLLSPALSRGLILVLSVLGVILFGWRMHVRPLSIAAIILSPTVIGSLLAGNLDVLILLGIFLPPVWGLLVLMIKPQIGLGVAIFYAFIYIRARQWRELLTTFVPVGLAFGVSALLFPDWLALLLHMPANPWNRTLFPYGIPVALLFLWWALRSKKPALALAATPFLAPYLTYYSYGALQFGLLDEEVEKYLSRDILQFLLMIALWVIMLVFHL